jgi:cytochrome oxidase Cu insertion factor (SCO1/SenC/PrrC family)
MSKKAALNERLFLSPAKLFEFNQNIDKITSNENGKRVRFAFFHINQTQGQPASVHLYRTPLGRFDEPVHTLSVRLHVGSRLA